MRLILASTSPRRREILALLGLPFGVIQPAFEEVISCERSIEEEVIEFAIGKAQSVARQNPQAIVIGSDTMISLDGVKIGKPRDLSDARAMLCKLAGRTHFIYTSVAIIDGLGGSGLKVLEKVTVKMRDFCEAEAEDYLACGESLDKAGAYSIQGEGSQLIASIDGDYLAAVGLPLKPVAEYLKDRGIALPLNVDRLYANKSFLNWQSF
ncbi:MAG TPA: Maf family protein [Candidatus Binatia bacterium]|jgi:septum formation protein